LTDQEKADHLNTWGKSILEQLRTGKSSDLIGAALVDTVNTFDIPIDYFESFLQSMTMDLTIDRYETFEDLQKYVYGSAVVIGLQMLPILGYTDDRAIESAAALGTAFQLANFIRDFDEDLDRGRIYLPQSELRQCGVTSEMVAARQLTPEIRKALEFQIERVRNLQAIAEAGIKYLNPISQPCIRAASELYCGIVDEVEKIGYDIFNHRAKTSQFRRLTVAGGALIQTFAARLR
jgi:phytoene synthase